MVGTGKLDDDVEVRADENDGELPHHLALLHFQHSSELHRPSIKGTTLLLKENERNHHQKQVTCDGELWGGYD